MLSHTLLVLLSFMLGLQFCLVRLTETGGNSSEQQNNRTSSIDWNEPRFAKWQLHLSQISGDINRKLCTCDLVVNECDIDCCCDQDCTQTDKYAFSRCQSLHTEEESNNRCWSRQHIFDRKKFHSAHSSRLLCVWRDNTGRQQLFANKNAITESGKLSSIKPKHYFKWVGRNHSNWVTDRIDASNGTVLQVKSILEYKSGKSIVYSRQQKGGSERVHHWQLPGTLRGPNGQCNHMRHVNYMLDFSSTCLLMLNHLAKTCSESQYLSVHYYHRGLVFNYHDLARDELRPVIVRPLANYSDVFFDHSKAECRNAVSQVEYTVWHAGIFGITQVTLKVLQVDLSNSSRSLKQKFTVKFEWAKNESDHFALSGNPGYIRDKSLIFAGRTVNQSYVPVEKRLLSTYRLGLCNVEQEISSNKIRFGINQFVSCRLQIDLNSTKELICNEIDRFIGKYLDQDTSDLFVASLGNTTRSLGHSDQWLQVAELEWQADSTLCGNLSRGVSFEMYFARVGKMEQVQNRVLGATLRKLPLFGLDVDCSSDRCTGTLDTDLVSSIDFLDVTELPRPEYAPAPSVKIELPSDFFYPFQSSSTSSLSSMIYSSTTISLLVFVSMACTVEASMFY